MAIKMHLSFLSLTILLSLIVTFQLQEITFTIGINEGDMFIWECKVCNIEEMDEIFGITWDDDGFLENLSYSRKLRWDVNHIESNLTSLKVNMSVWLWRDLEDWTIKDEEITLVQNINPSDYNSNFSFTNGLPFVPIWLPIPVGDYIGSLNLPERYDVDNRVLATININLHKNIISLNNPSKPISIIAIYSSNGILNTYKLYTENYAVVIDISLVDVPLYAIPATIGLVSIFLMSIGIYIYKKIKKGINK